ncbi:MAG: putative RNA methyltransferase [Candidatus Poribacteria bacterium]|nr:MAG: putative RNA methyltransferase [Candidatus Poribacteria bacterium]
MARRRRKKPTFAEQKLRETLESGLGLADPECPYFGECGGCVWQAIDYRRQLEFKREWIERTFHEYGLSEVEVPMPLPSPRLYGYRNKMEFSFAARRWFSRHEIESGDPLDRDFALGLHARGAFDRVLDIHSCPLQAEPANALLQATREFAKESGLPPYDIHAQEGFYRFLILRYGFYTDQLMVVLVTTRRDSEQMKRYVDFLHARELQPTSVVNGVTDAPASTSQGSELFVDFGEPCLEERLLGKAFVLEPDAFFQPNTYGAEVLAEKVLEYANLRGTETVLDLYCGVGVFAILAAEQAERVIGIEKLPSAVESARRNARRNGIDNAQFLAHDLDRGIRTLPGDARPEVVITDPPRAGMHARTIQAILDLAPERIISVSCHPVPQAENLAKLCAEGDYYIAEVQPVDLFPHTAHVENVALLMRS